MWPSVCLSRSCVTDLQTIRRIRAVTAPRSAWDSGRSVCVGRTGRAAGFYSQGSSHPIPTGFIPKIHYLWARVGQRADCLIKDTPAGHKGQDYWGPVRLFLHCVGNGRLLRCTYLQYAGYAYTTLNYSIS